MTARKRPFALWLVWLPFAVLALQLLTLASVALWLGKPDLLQDNRYAAISLAATLLAPLIGLCALPSARPLPVWLRVSIAILYLPTFMFSWIASGF